MGILTIPPGVTETSVHSRHVLDSSVEIAHPSGAGDPVEFLVDIPTVRPPDAVPLGVDICRLVLDHCELARAGNGGQPVVGGPGAKSAESELERGVLPVPGKLVVEGEGRCV